MDRRLATFLFLLTGFLLMVMPSMEIVLLGRELSALIMDILRHIGFVVLVVGAYITIRDYIRSLGR